LKLISGLISVEMLSLDRFRYSRWNRRPPTDLIRWLCAIYWLPFTRLPLKTAG
jgi:hypothetical protein